ncbi:hypothetical protein BDN72DRAFT_903097 [Pluteus cervinus]|uniref:Uncharacterized protein n=1 Tax=Pluteus cervinus TaxID=181527 RepID=A0ACD3AAQ0_9AGAR|nr:hypothetical protein BDN72DRAFT_903097 [Pluteus cervinus]
MRSINSPGRGTIGYRFNEKQTKFLRAHGPAYTAMVNSLDGEGPRGLGGVFGNKGRWVEEVVFPLFMQEFHSKESPENLAVLHKSLKSWFSNYHNYRVRHPGAHKAPRPPPSQAPASTLKTAATPALAKPKPVTALQVFAQDRHATLDSKFKAYREAHGNPPTTENLPIWNRITQDLWLSLVDEEQEDYRDRAKELNESYAKFPPRAEIFKNQPQLPQAIMTQFDKLHGFDWGQYGDGGVFIIGAFRTKSGDLQVYNVSASSARDACPFVAPPEAYAALRTHFVEHMEKTLPASDNNVDDLDEPVPDLVPIEDSDIEDFVDNNKPCKPAASPQDTQSPRSSPPRALPPSSPSLPTSSPRRLSSASSTSSRDLTEGEDGDPLSPTAPPPTIAQLLDGDVPAPTAPLPSTVAPLPSTVAPLPDTTSVLGPLMDDDIPTSTTSLAAQLLSTSPMTTVVKWAPQGKPRGRKRPRQSKAKAAEPVVQDEAVVQDEEEAGTRRSKRLQSETYTNTAVSVRRNA